MSTLKEKDQKLLKSWLRESENSIVVVVFSASWSGSAHLFYTNVKQVANRRAEISHDLVDIEESPDLATYFGVNTVPLSVVIREREIIDHIKGVINKKKLLERLLPHFDS